MRALFDSHVGKKETLKTNASVQSISESQLSNDEPPSEATQQAKVPFAKKKSLLATLIARPLSRRRIFVISGISFFALALVVLAAVLPAVFVKAHKHNNPEDAYTLVSSAQEDPSYHDLSNKPIFAVHNFPDPGLLHHNGTWYAYGTNPRKHDPKSIHVPVAISKDFINWTLKEGYDAMPTLGDWEVAVNHWAPDVIERVSVPRWEKSEPPIRSCDLIGPVLG